MHFLLPTLVCVLLFLPFCILTIFLNGMLMLVERCFKSLKFSLGLKIVDRITVKIRRILRSVAGHFYVFLNQVFFSYKFVVYAKVSGNDDDSQSSASHSSPDISLCSFEYLQQEIFQNAHNILIANHVLYTDWIYIWNFLVVACQDPSSVCFLMKQQLRSIPLIGASMEFLGFLFLKRNAAADIQYIHQKIDSLQEKRLNVVIFPEGTTIHLEGLQASKEFSAERGFKQLQHCLQPRIKGLNAILHSGERFQGIIDLTLCYPDAEYYATQEEATSANHSSLHFWEWYSLSNFWFRRIRPREVSLRVQYHRRESIPTGYEPLGDWLRERFEEKDHFLEDFYRNKGHPLHYKRAFVIPVYTKYAPVFILYLTSTVLLVGRWFLIFVMKFIIKR